MSELNLTASQRQAIETEAPEALVIAGAGSGKTEVLSQRIVHLIRDRGVSPLSMLVLTFTRKAAAEMRARVSKALEATGKYEDVAETLKPMLMGTFHSVALRILQSHGHRLGYNPRTINVIDEADADLLLKTICRELGYLKGKSAWKEELSWKLVSQFRNVYYSTGRMDMLNQKQNPACRRVLAEYRGRLKEMNVVDYGMLLLAIGELFHECPDALQAYRLRISHVLVDELQDTDEVQYDLHRWFSPPHAEFFGVGDRRQSIYRFRGARPDLMSDQHPEAEIIDLRECFRCGDIIVEAANTLIGVNGDRLAKPMIGATGRQGYAEAFRGRSIDVVRKVLSLLGHRLKWSDIAVLARGHRTLKRLASIFEEKGIPFHRVGSRFDLCETDEFRKVHALLRLCVNPRDNLAFLRIHEAESMSAYAMIRKVAAERGVSHYAAAVECVETFTHFWPWAYHEEWIEHPTEVPTLCELVAPVVAPHIAEFFNTFCEGMSVSEGLEFLQLRDGQDDLNPGEHVTLLTVHAAKGLEWPAVVVAGMVENTFPSSRSLGSPDDLMEERRVAYVAMTRASHLLAMQYRARDDQASNRPFNPPSRFLIECGTLATEMSAGGVA